MATSTGKQLAQRIRQEIGELKEICIGVDEATAVRAPEGRWSPKEILSHLCGPEGSGHMPILQAFGRRGRLALPGAAHPCSATGLRGSGLAWPAPKTG